MAWRPSPSPSRHLANTCSVCRHPMGPRPWQRKSRPQCAESDPRQPFAVSSAWSTSCLRLRPRSGRSCHPFEWRSPNKAHRPRRGGDFGQRVRANNGGSHRAGAGGGAAPGPRRGRGHQVESRPHLRDGQGRYQPAGLLRPIRGSPDGGRSRCCTPAWATWTGSLRTVGSKLKARTPRRWRRCWTPPRRTEPA